MTNITTILNKARLSDGSHHLPLSPQDRAMRLRHTEDSIEHQLKHIEDHGAELVVQLGKHAGLDRKGAEELIRKAETLLEKIGDDLEEYKSG